MAHDVIRKAGLFGLGIPPGQPIFGKRYVAGIRPTVFTGARRPFLVSDLAAFRWRQGEVRKTSRSGGFNNICLPLETNRVCHIGTYRLGNPTPISYFRGRMRDETGSPGPAIRRTGARGLCRLCAASDSGKRLGADRGGYGVRDVEPTGRAARRAAADEQRVLPVLSTPARGKEGEQHGFRAEIKRDAT
jgi:hypothetical protein